MMNRRWFHRKRLCSTSASERQLVSMNLPSTDISEKTNIRNVGVISREAALEYITPETAAVVNGFGAGLFFPLENSLLFLSDVTLASSSEQYHMLLETYFSVSLPSDVG